MNTNILLIHGENIMFNIFNQTKNIISSKAFELLMKRKESDKNSPNKEFLKPLEPKIELKTINEWDSMGLSEYKYL